MCGANNQTLWFRESNVDFIHLLDGLLHVNIDLLVCHVSIDLALEHCTGSSTQSKVRGPITEAIIIIDLYLRLCLYWTVGDTWWVWLRAWQHVAASLSVQFILHLREGAFLTQRDASPHRMVLQTITIRYHAALTHAIVSLNTSTDSLEAILRLGVQLGRLHFELIGTTELVLIVLQVLEGDLLGVGKRRADFVTHAHCIRWLHLVFHLKRHKFLLRNFPRKHSRRITYLR